MELVPADENATDAGQSGDPRTKLAALNDSFYGFERQLQQDVKAKKDIEDTQINAIRDHIARLEKTLNSEIKRRVEANKALQAMFDSQMATVQDKLEAIFVERFEQLHTAVDSLNTRMSVVEKDFTASREQYVHDIEDKSAKLREHEKKTLEKFQSEAEIC